MAKKANAQIAEEQVTAVAPESVVEEIVDTPQVEPIESKDEVIVETPVVKEEVVTDSEVVVEEVEVAIVNTDPQPQSYLYQNVNGMIMPKF